MEVTLLYQCDSWLSNDSKVLMGIFTDSDSLEAGISDLINLNRAKHFNGGDVEDYDYASDDDYDDAFYDFVEDTINELFSNGQTQGMSVNYMLVHVDTDIVGEI